MEGTLEDLHSYSELGLTKTLFRAGEYGQITVWYDLSTWIGPPEDEFETEVSFPQVPRHRRRLLTL